MSRCELTETYSPAAMDRAPRHHAREPGHQDRFGAGGGTRHSQHETRGRHDAVIGSEDGRPDLVGPFGQSSGATIGRPSLTRDSPVSR